MQSIFISQRIYERALDQPYLFLNATLLQGKKKLIDYLAGISDRDGIFEAMRPTVCAGNDSQAFLI